MPLGYELVYMFMFIPHLTMVIYYYTHHKPLVYKRVENQLSDSPISLRDSGLPQEHEQQATAQPGDLNGDSRKFTWISWNVLGICCN